VSVERDSQAIMDEISWVAVSSAEIDSLIDEIIL